jgi:hypothetical protein
MSHAMLGAKHGEVIVVLRVKNPNVANETVSLRVVRVGHVDRWLIVKTNLLADDPGMTKLIKDAHALLEQTQEFAGVEIQSVTFSG